MRILTTALITLVLSLSFAAELTQACTDIRVSAKDGTVLIARSMEYALDLQSNLRSSTRGRTFVSKAPNGKPGMEWKAKYAYVFLDGLNQDFAVDGMNEKGLSFEALYLPTLAKYQTVPAGQEQRALSYLNVGDWALSNFETVDQVRDAIKNVYVFPQTLAAAKDVVFPLHYALFDASGKGIVIEYINGQLNVHDNLVGVLTNTPSFDWHITNLNNYVHLTPTNPNPVVINGEKFIATGQGFGMIGLPGDISPPSRFVKMAAYLKVAIPPNDAGGALNIAEHIINNVDIPLGIAREPSSGQASNEITQWVIFKDLTHKIIYFRTYGNLSLRAVDMNKLNLAEDAPRFKMPIASPVQIINLTNQFQQSAEQSQT